MNIPIDIIITEDQEKWRAVMRDVFKDHNINIIAEAENGIELLKLLETLSPDVILLDLAMPKMDGTETMQWLTKKYPEKKVIIMSLFDEPGLMNDYRMRGARGSFSKTDVANMTELVSAIRKVHKGGTYFNFDRQAPSMKLSVRQKELITKLAEQKPTTQIAAELKLSTSAVDKQRKKIMDILGVSSLSDLYKKIYSLGLNYFRKPWKNDTPGKMI